MCISFDKKYVNTYEIQCGNFLFHIHTHLKSINLNAFEQIIANPSIPNFEINIWIDKNIDMLHFNTGITKGVEFVPSKLIEFYNVLDSYSIPHIPLSMRINRFYNMQGIIYASFPYTTDNFYVAYRPREQEVFVIGDEITLERIIVDFLSVTSPILPLHGACVKIKDTSVIILGESKTGKSSFILKLMDIGAEYISDDILFIRDDEVIRQGSYIGLRNDFIPEKLKSLNHGRMSDNYSYLNVVEMEKTCEYRLGNSSKINDVYMIHPMEYSKLDSCQLFPMIPHESMWCVDVLDFDFSDVAEKIYESKAFYYNFLKNHKKIKVDFVNFDECCQDFYEHLFYDGIY